MAKAKKTADELLNEAEELQKKVAPELFDEEPVAEPPIEETPASSETPPIEEPPVEPAPAADEPNELDTLRAEVKRLQDEMAKEESARRRLSDRDRKIDRYEQDIDTLRKEIDSLKVSQERDKPQPVDKTRATLIEKYGEDSEAVEMYDTLSAKVKAAEDTMLGEIKTVKDTVGAVSKHSVESAEAVFLDKLTSKVSDWSSIVNTEDFKEFLSVTKVPFSKSTLYDALVDAAREHDADRVAEIYGAFKVHKTPAPAVETPKPPDKEKLIAPTSTGKGDMGTPQVQILTPEDLRTMTVKIATLRSQNRNAEADKIAKEIDRFLDGLGNIAG